MMETIAKINKTKSLFFEKINKIDKPSEWEKIFSNEANGKGLISKKQLL